MLSRFIILFCSVHICASHLCMLNPAQRTPLTDINKPDSDSCILLKGPCGGTIPTANKLSIVGGTNFTVIFQKNLNHFNEAHPGYWSVSMAKAEGSSFTELFRITDTDVPSLTLYTATVTAPEVATGSEPVPMVLQTRYVTNNPKAPSAFYQCGDVLVRRKD